jgi:hypothetical protein
MYDVTGLRKIFRYSAVAFNGATWEQQKKRKELGTVLYGSKSQHHTRSAGY